MRHSIASSWSLVAAVLATVVPSCTTGVNDSGFTGFNTAAPPQNTGVTTFEETDDPPVETDGGGTTDGGSADETSDTMPPPTTATTMPDPTTGAGDCNPPCAAGEVCIDGVCFDDGNESSGGGGCNSVPGNYESCLGAGGAVSTAGCGGGTPTCITGGMPPIAGVCSQTNCVDACDCPAAPPTGNAVVTCDAITGDGTNFCYLDCASGQTCPTGMTCFGGIACVWPGDGADGVPYGDCFNNDISICGLDGICLSDGAVPTVSVCTQACANVGACPPSPGGTAPVSCEDVTGDLMNECILDCSLGSCPAGMTCFGGFLCAWN